MTHRSEVIFEMRRVGDVVKVSACDPVTNTEVSIVGSARLNPITLRMIALQKLRHALAKNQRLAQRAR